MVDYDICKIAILLSSFTIPSNGLLITILSWRAKDYIRYAKLCGTHLCATADQSPQNYISVKNDWSDLDDKMEHYLSHPEEAKHVAAEGVRTFRDRYLTPAAEACYWRKLIHEYAKVQTWEPQLYKEVANEDGTKEFKRRGVSWERFVFRPPKKLDYVDQKIDNWDDVDFDD